MTKLQALFAAIDVVANDMDQEAWVFTDVEVLEGLQDLASFLQVLKVITSDKSIDLDWTYIQEQLQ